MSKLTKTLFLLFLVFLYSQGFAPAARAQQLNNFFEVTLSLDDRILILAPHPDDEVIACSGVIERAVHMKLPIRIVFLTYGDNNQWSFLVLRKHPVFIPKAVENLGLRRKDEAIAASKYFGLSPDQLVFLGYPDFGTMNIWYSHWGSRPPFRSMLTRVKAVPYKGAMRPGAPYKGEEILKDLTQLVREFKPTKIFVSHPADHNGDHRSLYLFLRVALWDLNGAVKPQVFSYLVHYKRWPPKTRKLNQLLEPPEALKGQIPWESFHLTPAQVIIKLKALKAHKSQYRSSAKYLRLFVRSNELFGDFPTIKLQAEDFHLPLLPEEEELAAETYEELTDVERGAFVGVEWRYVKLEGQNLVISIELSRRLGKGVESSIYVFGYRSNRSFGQMPKLHAKLGVLNSALYDQNQKLPKNTIQITREPKEITVRIPLKVLGYPEKIMTSAQTYLGNVPLDWVSWRILELPARTSNVKP